MGRNLSHIVPAASVVVLRRDGAALLQLRDPADGRASGGLWAFPGGKLLPAEEPADGARRELAEETALTAGALLPLGEHRVSHGELEFHIHVFGTRFSGDEAALCCGEGLALRFVTRDEARALPLAQGIELYWDRAQMLLGG